MVSFSHSQNAQIGMMEMEGGMVMLSRLEHQANAHGPIDLMDEGIVMLLRLRQKANASFPMDVREFVSGIEIVSRFLQP